MQVGFQTQLPSGVAIDPSTDPRYDRFTAQCDGAGAYHAGAWARILTAAYGGRPRYLALPGEGDELQGVMPLIDGRGLVSGRRLRSLPVVPQAGPVARSMEGEVALMAAACRLADERGAALMVNSRVPGYEEQLSELSATPKNPAWITALPDDADELRRGWKKTSNNLFRSIGKSERAGVTVREGQGRADLRSFYRLYLATMRRHRSLPRSWRQISLDQRLLGPGGVFRLFVAEHESRPVAAAVFHAYRDTVDLLYNGSDESARDARPNFALYWHAMRWAIENGFRRFDWGEAQQGGPLSRFKAQWSAEPVPEYRYDYLPGESPGSARADRVRHLHDVMDAPEHRGRRAQLVEAAWDRAPLPLTGLAGAVVYRLF